MSHGVLIAVIFSYCTANMYQMAQLNYQGLILPFTHYFDHVLISHPHLGQISLFCNLRGESTEASELF